MASLHLFACSPALFRHRHCVKLPSSNLLSRQHASGPQSALQQKKMECSLSLRRRCLVEGEGIIIYGNVSETQRKEIEAYNGITDVQLKEEIEEYENVLAEYKRVLQNAEELSTEIKRAKETLQQIIEEMDVINRLMQDLAS